MEFRNTDSSQSTTGKAYHQMCIHLIIQRLWHSYVQNEAFILSLLVSFEWFSFSLEASELWDRLEMIITLLLAMVAMKFNIRANMPDVGYNTMADWHTLLCFITSGLLMTWNVVANKLAKRAGDNDADLETASQIDMLVAAAMGGVWIALHVYMACITLAYNNKNKKRGQENARQEREDIQQTLNKLLRKSSRMLNSRMSSSRILTAAKSVRNFKSITRDSPPPSSSPTGESPPPAPPVLATRLATPMALSQTMEDLGLNQNQLAAEISA
jgi:uncharacterized membrane protein